MTVSRPLPPQTYNRQTEATRTGRDKRPADLRDKLRTLPATLRSSRITAIRANATLLERVLGTLRADLTPATIKKLSLNKVGEVRAWWVADAALAACGGVFEAEQAAAFLAADSQAQALTYLEWNALAGFWRLGALEGLLSPDHVSDSLDTLNALDTLSWTSFLERVSPLEAALRRDPAGVYADMTIRTRQRYRQAAQRHAQATGKTEVEVAQMAAALAQEAGGAAAQPLRLGHVGEYLIGRSAGKLRERLGGKPFRTFWDVQQDRLTLYLLSIAVLAGLGEVALVWLALAFGASLWTLMVVAILGAIPALVNAAGLVSWAVTLLVPPRPLPALDFYEGLPARAKTVITVPVLLRNAGEVQDILRRLERHWLTARDEQVNVALLSDFADADQAELPQDAELLKQVQAGLDALRTQYGPHFFVFHRARRWNPQEGVWMGYERKRGKLEEFNAALLGGHTGGFSHPATFPEELTGTRFVLTLDADTVMLPGTLRHLAGILAHPLCTPDVDPRTGRLRAGYTVLQPRLAAKPRAARRSLFTRLNSGDSGLDLYSPLVSEAYHDLFGAAVFTGKGLYDVAAFTRTLRGRVPENALLSHDLFEGLHGRVGWVGDSVLLEDLPSHPQAHLTRLERWVRGDWALLPWLGPQVPLRRGQGRTAFGWLGRWKIVHNLLRSLFAPALLALLLFAWLYLPSPGWAWTLLGVLALGIPFLTGLLRVHRGGLSEWRADLQRWALSLALLPQEALTTLGAAWRAITRLRSGRHRLEWMTAAQGQTAGQSMPLTPWLALLLGAALLMTRPEHFLAAVPLLGIWTAFPFLSGMLSRETPAAPQSLITPPDGQATLRLAARRTWLYFERFAGPEDHWLPPDHYQHNPRGLPAHRTSPTNIGLMLLSTLSARDLGYLGWPELAVRVSETFDTLDRLEKHQGHWLNWYDTQTLQPLPPRYLSAVDSGNLLGAFVALRQGLLEAPASPVWSEADWHGYLDTLRAIGDAYEGTGLTPPPDLNAWVASASAQVHAALDKPQEWPALLDDLLDLQHPKLELIVLDTVQALHEPQPALIEELGVWAERAGRHLADLRMRRDLFLPWLSQARWRDGFPVQPTFAELVEVLGKTTPQSASLTAPLRGEPRETTTLPPLEGRCPEGAEGSSGPEQPDQPPSFTSALQTALDATEQLLSELAHLAERTETYIQEMQWSFLDDPERGLLRVGMNLDRGMLDAGAYDLLASEARLSSYLAVALGGLDVRHWTGLGRPMTRLDGQRTLLSWSGTMFEYLMPPLLMRSPPDTLLDDAARRAIAAQKKYGQERGVPWGISESGYSRLDDLQNYQYRAFGVPDLALHRDPDARLLVAPYASLMALPWDVRGVLDNLEHLTREGLRGLYGFYEAKDYGPNVDPVPENGVREGTVIQSFMAHHQGMALVCLGNVLSGKSMVERFHRDPRIQTAEMLLYETTPLTGPLHKPWTQPPPAPKPTGEVEPWTPEPARLDSAFHVLGYAGTRVLLTGSGRGESGWNDLQLSRWREESGLYGMWLYLQDEESGALWSATLEPIPATAQEEEVTFHPHQAEFRRVVQEIESHLTVTVTPEGAEVRELTLSNRGDTAKTLRVTLAAEVTLNIQRADVQSPAFSNLSVETSFEDGTLLFRRRTGGSSAGGACWAHKVLGAEPTFETRRDVFYGRLESPESPFSLPNFTGAPLDPMLALAADVEIPAQGHIKLVFLSAAGADQTQALNTLNTVQDENTISEAIQRAKQQATHELRELEFSPPEFRLALELLSAMHSRPAHLRPDEDMLERNRLGRESLWAHGISGDLPILLLDVTSEGEDALVDQVLRAWRWWSARGWECDLILLNLGDSVYAQDTHEALNAALYPHEGTGQNGAGTPGRGQVRVLRGGALHTADLNLLRAAANVILSTNLGRLEDQLFKPGSEVPTILTALSPLQIPFIPAPDIVHGFSDDGREYVIHLPPGASTPAPWVNVIANPYGGTLVSEAGASCTWAVNAGEFRLTPWSGDSVLDPSGEALILRDSQSGEEWQLPDRHGARTVRHGAGYTTIETTWGGLDVSVRTFVPPDAPLKVVTLRVQNRGSGERRLDARYAVHWCLGNTLEAGQKVLYSWLAGEFSAVLARQPWVAEWSEQVAFLSAAQDVQPELPGQVHAELICPPNGSAEISFLLGAGLHQTGAEALLREYRDPERVERAWREMNAQWDSLLGAVQLRTPDSLLNTFLNRWLPYQTLSARFWGRTGFSQPGGAFGFRDQLQDVLSVMHADAGLARAHLLLCARHQFEAGDVLHWWHPPGGAGVRTRISDDLLWLPYALDEYLRFTDDQSVLNEQIPWLHAEELRPDEHERYTVYPVTEHTASLLEHALKAIERADQRGAHGLPLIGTGDWNDGLNRVGDEGKGESVWLGFFLADLYRRYAERLTILNDLSRAENYRQRADSLREALETSGWDGGWYRRAYDDQGQPLGTRGESESQIDALPQAWAVIAGVTDPARARQAMKAAENHLWREDLGIYLLLEPPYDGERDVGYIRAYPPGIRENGGQYTHAATWMALAYARLGDGNRAHRLIHQLLPAAHTALPGGVHRYQREPYAVAGDIYSHPQHPGQGGWSWYTGAAGWLYRAALEGLLGLKREGNMLHINPALPDDWTGFEVWYRVGDHTQHIQVSRGNDLEIRVDGVVVRGGQIPLN